MYFHLKCTDSDVSLILIRSQYVHENTECQTHICLLCLTFSSKQISLLLHSFCVCDRKPFLNIYMEVVIFITPSLVGDLVELPKWLKMGSRTKKCAKSKFLWMVEGSLSIGSNLGSECLEC